MDFFESIGVKYRLDDLRSITYNKNNKHYPYHLDFGKNSTDVSEKQIGEIKRIICKRKLKDGFIASIPGLLIGLVSLVITICNMK